MRFLFVDRILQLQPGGITRGLKHITADDYYLCRDEQGTPCFIPSLIGETLGQLAAWNAMYRCDFAQRPVAGVVGRAHLYRPAYVGETLLLESHIESLDEDAIFYHGVARVGEDVIFRVENALGPLLPMSDFIDATQIRKQFNEINRPGPWPPDTPNVEAGEQLSHPAQAGCTMTFDRVLFSEPGTKLVAEKRVSLSAPYFPDHFPNKPVLPLTVLLECKLNLAREFLRRADFPVSYQVTELRKIKMKEFILPGDVVTCSLNLKQNKDDELILSYQSDVAGRRICVLEVLMTAIGER